MRSQMTRMLGVPDNIHKVARAIGHEQSTMGDIDNGSNSGQDLLKMLSIILPFLANLNTTRFLFSSFMENQINLADHQSSLSSLIETVQLIIRPDKSVVEFKDIVTQALHLSLQGNRKNYLGAIILVHAIMKDPEVIKNHSGPKIPYTIIQSAMIHYNQDTKDPVAGTINQELAS